MGRLHYCNLTPEENGTQYLIQRQFLKIYEKQTVNIGNILNPAITIFTM